MKEIKRLLEERLKDLLKNKTNSYEKESLLANAAKTYINSIMMIDDYMKEEQTNKWFAQQDLISRSLIFINIPPFKLIIALREGIKGGV